MAKTVTNAEPEELYVCDKCGKKDVPESDCSFGDDIAWCSQCCADNQTEC